MTGRALRRWLAAALLGGLWLAPGAGAQPGDAGRGREVFTAKRCARCHLPRGERGIGPPLEEIRRRQGAYELAGRFWNHAPGMFTILAHERIEWPRFSAPEMADLMAYLGADPARDGTPDLRKGQLALVAKGCLKCHRFGPDGARLAPDLAGKPERYAPAAVWAATLWAHTPRMAAMAIERAVLYPRFSGSEMADLMGFLRSAGPRE